MTSVLRRVDPEQTHHFFQAFGCPRPMRTRGFCALQLVRRSKQNVILAINDCSYFATLDTRDHAAFQSRDPLICISVIVGAGMRDATP